MNLSNSENLISDSAKVLSLYGQAEEANIEDPLEALLLEAGVSGEDEVELSASFVRPLRIQGHHSPEAGLYVIEEQLAQLRSRLHRIKFYLNEINDLLPG